MFEVAGGILIAAVVMAIIAVGIMLANERNAGGAAAFFIFLGIGLGGLVVAHNLGWVFPGH